MRRVLLLSIILISLLLAACDPEETEVITYSGLDETVFAVGSSIDLFDSVNFTSNTRGDITQYADTDMQLDPNIAKVYVVTYTVLYENGDPFTVERRVIVRNESIGNENTLIANGDFTDTINYLGFHEHQDYPNDIDYIWDPDLWRLQVLITEPSSDTVFPFITLDSNLELSASQTYTLQLLVSGTEATSFTFDIVELDEFYNVVNVIYPQTEINVTNDELGMSLVDFTITPLQDTTIANLRFLFGETDGYSPSGNIFIDNIEMYEDTD